jgi:hypothetical protein
VKYGVKFEYVVDVPEPGTDEFGELLLTLEDEGALDHYAPATPSNEDVMHEMATWLVIQSWGGNYTDQVEQVDDNVWKADE